MPSIKSPSSAISRFLRGFLLLSLIAAVNLVAIYWEDLFASPKYVLIHSDDAGMCHTVNQATIDAMEKGIVTSASILVNCPGFSEIAEYARSHPEKDFGVHLNLTSEVPWLRWGSIIPPDKVQSLLKPDGSFWNTSEEVAIHAKAEEAEEELRAQIDKALQEGIPVSHLDHHMFVLLQRPDLLNLYVKLGKEYNLPIRLHRTFPDKEVGTALRQAKEAYQKAVDEQIARKMPLLDFIEADNYDQPPRDKLNYHLNTIYQIQPGVSEILIHCAYQSQSKDEPVAPHVTRREADTKAFLSEDIKQAINDSRIRLVNWKDLRRISGG